MYYDEIYLRDGGGSGGVGGECGGNGKSILE